MSKSVNLYVIYDKLAEESGPIYQSVNDGVAIRQYNNLLADCTDKDDYDLICIGEFDTHTMSVNLIEPRNIILNSTYDYIDKPEFIKKEA